MSGYFREASASIAVNTASLRVAQIPSLLGRSLELSEGCCRRGQRGCAGGRWSRAALRGWSLTVQQRSLLSQRDPEGSQQDPDPAGCVAPFPGTAGSALLTAGTRARGHRRRVCVLPSSLERAAE